MDFCMWYDRIRSVLQKNNSGVKEGLKKEERASTWELTVVMIHGRDTRGLSMAFSRLNVKEGEDEGRTKRNVLDVGKENWFRLKKQLEREEQSPPRHSPATQVQEAVPETQKPSGNLVSEAGCKRGVTTEQCENSGKLQSGPRVQE